MSEPDKESHPQKSSFCHEARQLTDDEISKLLSDTEVVTPFRQQKLEKEAKKNWDIFYKRNAAKFFRDRNWTIREFGIEELLQKLKSSEERKLNLLEAGCGVGNFVWPLIKLGLPFNYYASDFSPVALNLFRQNELYKEELCQVFQADLSEPNALISKLNSGLRFHVVSLIFVLSAIHPDKMLNVLRNVAEILDNDGILIFRDYGLYDYAMLRFSTGSKLGDNFYVRQDGTRAYYFSKEIMRDLAAESDLEIINLEYIQRETVNVKESLSVPRIFLQGKFKRKNSPNSE